MLHCRQLSLTSKSGLSLGSRLDWGVFSTLLACGGLGGGALRFGFFSSSCLVPTLGGGGRFCWGDWLGLGGGCCTGTFSGLEGGGVEGSSESCFFGCGGDGLFAGLEALREERLGGGMESPSNGRAPTTVISGLWFLTGI